MKDLIDQTLEELKQNFAQRISFPASFRKSQLNSLLKGVEKMKSDMEEGVLQDLGRCCFWTEVSEILALIDFINHHIDNLDEYMQDVHDDPAILFMDSDAYVRLEPLGVALVMGSWNYPYFVGLKPLVMCIAAGNCAVLKPSEFGPCASKCIEILVTKYLDNRCYRVI